ncbi:uncharacterized protein [Nicotiana tomentosiformis]|uniref:uncharacterized protein n=1 Tax=Nicotiana tomentosiformis TaxID=4098 RepID=UPI00388C4CA8
MAVIDVSYYKERSAMNMVVAIIGLPKDIEMRPSSADDDIHANPPALKQVKEKGKRKSPIPSDSEKKRPRKRLAHKLRKVRARECSSDSLYLLRDKSEEEKDSELVARASLLHHEAFFRIWEEHEAEVRELTEKGDTYRLLSEKLRANLKAAQSEHIEMAKQVFRVLHDSEDKLEIVTNDPILQVRQMLEQIDVIQAEAEEFKKNMDILASKKETVQAQLELAETQLQAVKEKASVQVKKIEELQYQLDLAISYKANLANEFEVARSEMVVDNAKADAKVAQFKIDAEAIQAKAKSMVDHAKWQARREALEGVHAQGFDILAEIENDKTEEARARKLAFPEEDSESLSESEDGEDTEDGDATSDEDHAT